MVVTVGVAFSASAAVAAVTANENEIEIKKAVMNNFIKSSLVNNVVSFHSQMNSIN